MPQSSSKALIIIAIIVKLLSLLPSSSLPSTAALFYMNFSLLSRVSSNLYGFFKNLQKDFSLPLCELNGKAFRRASLLMLLLLLAWCEDEHFFALSALKWGKSFPYSSAKGFLCVLEWYVNNGSEECEENFDKFRLNEVKIEIKVMKFRLFWGFCKLKKN